MKKIRYKTTGCFGENNEGDIVDAYILIQGVDSGVALVYHPKTSKYTCASIEFCAEDQNGYWASVSNIFKPGDDIDYVNIDSQRLLDKLAKNVAALEYN